MNIEAFKCAIAKRDEDTTAAARAFADERTEENIAPRKKNSSQKGASSAIENTNAETAAGFPLASSTVRMSSSIASVDADPNNFVAKKA